MSRGPRLPGIGAHHSANPQTDEWLTPPDVLAAAAGDRPFALDPCIPIAGLPAAQDPTGDPWPLYADRTLDALVDGLTTPWDPSGDVWLNPPYSDIAPWVARLAQHPAGGVALTFARTETRWWFDHVWPHASSLLFLQGRLTFWQTNPATGLAAPAKRGHNSGGPSVLIAYGTTAGVRLASSGLPGALVTRWHHPTVSGGR